MKTLEGKVAVVAGGGRDIGLAAALKLAWEGASVAINYFSSSAGADEAVTQIEAHGGRAFALQGDLTQQGDVDALIARTMEEFGSIDILVNNAGIVADGAMALMSYEDWAAQGRKTMKDRVIEKTRDIIANFEGPISKVPEDTKKKIADILQAAEAREAEKAGAENK